MSVALGRLGAAITSTLDRNYGQRRLLYIFTYLAGLTAIQVMHLALDDLRLNAGLTGGLTAGFVYSYYLAPRWRSLTTYSVSALAVLLMGYYYLRLQQEWGMLGNYLGILLGILMVLLAFKAFSPADHRFILMVCVVFLLFSSVASYDLKFMILLPVFIGFAGFSLYIGNQVEVAVRVGGTVGKRFTLHFAVDASFLWILVRAVVGIIVLSIIAYIITPHTTYQNHALVFNTAPRVEPMDPSGGLDNANQSELDQQSDELTIGLGQDMDLTDPRRLSVDPKPVLKVRSHRNNYLRAQVFDVYTGSGWVKSLWLEPPVLHPQNVIGKPWPNKDAELSVYYEPSDRSIALQPADEENTTFDLPLIDFPSTEQEDSLKAKMHVYVVEDNIYSNNVVELDYDIVRQEVTLLDSQPPLYFAVYQPYLLENVSLTHASELFSHPLLNQAAIVRAQNLDIQHPKDFSYTVYSLAPRIAPNMLAEVLSPGPDEITKRYTQLPLNESPTAEEQREWGIEYGQYRPISQRLINFARTLVVITPAEDEDAIKPTPWDKVKAIYDYLTDTDEFTYSRQFTQIESDQEICEAFVLGSQEGYCRYFASAMAVLCRINGIPARLVTGYAPGTYSFVDNAHIYRDSNAHVWVEVYFDGYGWVMFDPTPTSRDHYNRNERTLWIGGIIDFLQDLFIIDPASTQQALIGALLHGWDLAVQHLAWTITIAGVLTIAIVAWWLRRRFLRCRQLPRLVPDNPVVAAYLAIITELCKLGLRPQTGQTARKYLEAAARKFSSIAEELDTLLPVYERAAYAPMPVSTEESEQAYQVQGIVKSFVRHELEKRKRR